MLLVALLGADKPPPPGFLLVLAMIISLVLLIAFTMPRWRATKAVPQCRSLRGPGVQGAVAGVAYWLIALALPISGEASITMTPVDYVVAAAVAASLGAAVATVLFNLA